jgi:hypothetical protein
LKPFNNNIVGIALLCALILASCIGGGIVYIIVRRRRRNISKQEMEMMEHPQPLSIPQSHEPSTSNSQDRPSSAEYDEINETNSNVTFESGSDGYLQPISSQAGPTSEYANVTNLKNEQEVGEYHYILHKGCKI